MFLNNPHSPQLPDRFKQTLRPQKQYNHHCDIGKNNSKLRPEQDTKRMGDTKNKGPHQGTPHVPQPSDNDDEKSFNDECVIHPQSNTHGRGDQSSSYSGKVTPNDESDGEYPADID